MSHTVEIDTAHPTDGAAVITLTGPCDVYTAEPVRRALIDLVNEARCRQVVDLTGVDFIDSTGLAVLVGAAKRARRQGGELVLAVDLTSPVGKALRITGIHKGIRHAPSVGDALELLADQPAPAV